MDIKQKLDELVENLKGTEYYPSLHRIQESGSVTLFDYDLTLNQYNLSTLWKKRKKIFEKERRQL